MLYYDLKAFFINVISAGYSPVALDFFALCCNRMYHKWNE